MVAVKRIKPQSEARRLEAIRHQRSFKENQMFQVVRQIADKDASDPFVFGRLVAHFKQGVLDIDDLRKMAG